MLAACNRLIIPFILVSPLLILLYCIPHSRVSPLLICLYCIPHSRVSPLLIVLPAVEGVVGIKSANLGCWCVLDFFNIRPDNGVRIYIYIYTCNTGHVGIPPPVYYKCHLHLLWGKDIYIYIYMQHWTCRHTTTSLL